MEIIGIILVFAFIGFLAWKWNDSRDKSGAPPSTPKPGEPQPPRKRN